VTAFEPPTILGLARLARMVFERVDLQPQWDVLATRATDDPTDAAAMLDLATMLLLTGQSEQGLMLQAQALALQSCYRRPAEGAPSLRVLAIMTPGDMMANTPIDFLLAGSDIELISLYVAPGLTMPTPLPAHDVAFLAIGESETSRPLLMSLAPLMPQWPGPLLNGEALRIAGLTRDGVSTLLAGAPGLVAPQAVRADRAGLARIAAGEALPPGMAFPIIARPIESHAGTGLEKLDDAAMLGAYLAGQAGDAFYISPFVDYASADGLFRKQRIALIRGRPFVCHLAVSPRWTRARCSQPNPSKQMGVAMAPPALRTTSCQSVPQPSSGAWPMVSNSNSVRTGTAALAPRPRTSRAKVSSRRISSRFR